MPRPHRFGRYEVRPDERVLLVDGKPAALGARAFALLLALLERRDRLVTKEELLRVVWSGLVVSENNLHTQISTLRSLLGADAIATIPGRGYKFALAREDDAAGASSDASLAGEDGAKPAFDGRRLDEKPNDDEPSQSATTRAPSAVASPLRFGKVEVLPQRRQLLIDGQPAVIGSRAFDLLLVLMELRPRVIGKNELIDRVWPGVVVEENNLQTQISTLRKLVGPQAIETIPGRGYRFTAVEDDDDAPPPAEPSAPEIAHAQRLTNLTVAAEALFGRQHDLDTLASLAAEHRLVTVLGAGGIGKTSLAQALARQLVGRYADGVWWVDLSSVASPENLPAAVGNAANVQLGQGDVMDSLLRGLEPRETLVVLDNCERLAGAVSQLAEAALAAAPRLRILATSQEMLKTHAEQVYRLDPLVLPPAGTPAHEARSFSALQLFEQRALAADRRFLLTEHNVEVAIRLCRRLDGIPLAIEMAAARLPLLGLEALDGHLGERLQLLKAGSRVAPARQQTLRATLDWSHALLTADEQVVLRRLAVFAGSFRLDTAKKVAESDALDEWAVLDALAGLVDKSLVQLEQREPPRYRLLETTRLYAAERLAEQGESEFVAQRHARAMAQLGDECEEAYWSTPDVLWLNRYAPEYDDLQVAFDHACRRGDADIGAPTLDALFRLDHLRASQSTIHSHLQRALALLESASPMMEARLRLRFGSFFVNGVAEVPKPAAAQAAAVTFEQMDDRARLYEARLNLAVNLAMLGRFDEAEEALGRAFELKDPEWPARMHWLGAFHRTKVRVFQGDSVAYRASVRDELGLAEQVQSPCQIINARVNAADAALMAGDWDEAISLGRAAVDEIRPMGAPHMLAVGLLNLSAALLGKGDLPAARAVSLEALPHASRNKLSGPLLSHVSLLAARLARPHIAAQLLGYAEAWFAGNQHTLEPSEARATRLATELIEAALGPVEVSCLRSAGAELTEAQAHVLAQEMLGESDQGSKVQRQRQGAR